MQANNLAVYAQGAKSNAVLLSAASTADGTGSVELAVVGGKGGIVTNINVMPTATAATATGVVLFLQKAGSTLKVPFRGVDIPTYTWATTKSPPGITFDASEAEPYRLEAGDKLFVGTLGATGQAVTAQWSDF